MKVESGDRMEHRRRRHVDRTVSARDRSKRLVRRRRDEQRVHGVAQLEQAGDDETAFGDEEIAFAQPIRIANVAIRLEPRVVVPNDLNQ